MLKGRISGRTTAVALCMIAAQAASGQGFGLLSGRNHPELNWQIAATDHFHIIYPQRLAGIETQAAAIAESAYGVLADNMGVSFDEPIRVYLSDEDDIGNGFAIRIGTGWTNIWVNSSQVATDWTGREKWLRKVIPHELAHIFHYRATRSRLGPLDVFFSNPLPRFWTEGLAQYQTENWDALRGDVWLRTAVLEDRLSYRDGRSIWNGRLLYAVGNSQVRYLAAQYGDSTITNILAHRRPALIGLAGVHDFEDAFKAVTGKTYRDFYDEWRRTVNVYYNTLAGQMATVDSLDGTRTKVPGQYVYDVKSAAQGSLVVLNLESVDRPVRRIALVDKSSGESTNLAEGSIRPPLSVSEDGRLVAFSRLGRGSAGSLVYDLFMVDTRTGEEKRLTFDRRTDSPAFSPDAGRLAFVASAGGTANIIIRDLASGRESQATSFDGDVQISQLAWHPARDSIAHYIFDKDGGRRIQLLSLPDGAISEVTDGAHDDRMPIWSPDGERLGFTSLRDGVPNVFSVSLSSDSLQRVTGLATGATLTEWTSGNSGPDSLIVIVADSKKEDRVYRTALRHQPDGPSAEAPAGYARWTAHRPPRTVPMSIEADPTLIRRRSRYSAWGNLTHALSGGLPFYNDRDDWGVIGGTIWVEPLGKHLIAAAAGISVPSPWSRSFLAATYINNQFTPSIALGVSRLPNTARPYSDDLLEEDRNEAILEAAWPIDWRSGPYLSTSLRARIRFFDLKPLNAEDFAVAADGVPIPEAGQQVAVRLSVKRKKLRPYRDNPIHPLDGWGVRARITAATRDADLARSYVRFETSAYRVLPVVGRHRLFLYGRFRGQEGTALPQDFVSLSRYDALRIEPIRYLDLTFTDADRVRGYRRVVIGGRVVFGSIEYRIPLVPSLQTQFLGVVSLGATTLAPFVDAGVVWSRPAGFDPVYQYGAGVEIKNTLQIAGLFSLTHALGFARPIEDFGSGGDTDVYYKIQTALPF